MSDPDFSSLSDDEVLRLAGGGSSSPGAGASSSLSTTPSRVFAGGFTNLLNALTFGVGDEVVSGGNAALDAILPSRSSVPDWVPDSLTSGPGYDARLANARAARSEFRQEAGPWAYVQDIGAGFGLPASFLGKAKEGASLASRVGQSAKTGAAIGGATGFGESEGGLLNRIEGGATGAGIGGGVGALLTALVGGAGDIADYFTRGGQERKAANMLRDVGVPKDVAPSPSAYGQPTLAEVTQQPGVASLQKSMAMEPGVGDALAGLDPARQTKRIEALQELAPDSFTGITADVRGNVIQPAVIKTAEREMDRAGRAFEGIDPKRMSKIPIADEQARVAEQVSELFRDKPTGMQSKTREIVDAFISDPMAEKGADPRGWKHYAELRGIEKDAGEQIGKMSNAGHTTDVKALEIVKSAIGGSKRDGAGLIERAAKGGSLGEEDAAQYLAAKLGYIDTAGKYGSGTVADITRKGQYGGLSMYPSSVPERIFSSPESAKQFAKSFGDKPELMQQARGGLLDKMAAKSPDTWPKYFEKYRPQFKALFGDDFLTVKKVIQDLASEQSVGQLAQKASGRSSWTAQGQTSARFVSDRLGKSLKGLGATSGALAGLKSGLGGPGVLMGTLAGVAAGNTVDSMVLKSESAIKALIIRGLRDPAFAREILQKPSESTLSRLAGALTVPGSLEAGVQSGQGGR